MRPPRPICFACRVEMVPRKNGQFIHLTSEGRPYQVWSGDLWGCDGCDAQVVVGYGARPLAEHYEDHFAATVEIYRPVEVLGR